jgi:small subunit ribosomal protein S9
VAQKVAEYSATGRRKTAVARVRLAHGVGKVVVNKREFKVYFPTETVRTFIEQPLKTTDTLKRFAPSARRAPCGTASPGL